ncbi:MAG TPA: GT-D fold domain-containing glycosyltransferase, partial [Paenibacillus sp.]
RRGPMRRRRQRHRLEGSNARSGTDRTRRSSKKRPPQAGSSSNEVPLRASVLPDQHGTRRGTETFDFEEGYRQGLYDGGDAKVEKFIPEQMILPELTIDDVIQTGIQSLSSSFIPIMTTAEVYQELDEALEKVRPFSLVRLGDGELLTLAHDTVMPVEQVRRWGWFLPYAGVHLPDSQVRIDLARAISRANIVGIPMSRHPSYQGLLFPVLRYYGIDYRRLKLAWSTVNYALNEEGRLRRLLTGRKVLLVGNETPGMAKYFQGEGIQIQGTVAPVHGVSDVQRVMNQIAHIDFDIAFVSAGIAAVILCVRIADELSKAALDMGHLANKITSGELSLT